MIGEQHELYSDIIPYSYDLVSLFDIFVNMDLIADLYRGKTLFLLNTFCRFSKQQRLPVWLQTCESVIYSTDITASFVRRANCQILVSLPLMPETKANENDLKFVITPKKCFFTFVIVLGKIYELLGVLAEVHPSEMVNNSDKLYKAYLGELKEQVCLQTNQSS